MQRYRPPALIRRILGHVLDACGAVSALSLGALCLLILADVLTRATPLPTVPWALEVSEYLLMFATFSGAPWLLRSGGHIAIDVVLRRLRARSRRRAAAAADLIGLCVCGVIFTVALGVMTETRAANYMVFKTLIFPEWYLFVPVVICFGLMALEFLLRLLDWPFAPADGGETGGSGGVAP